MVGGGYLTLDVAGYGGLSIAKKGRALIEGDGSFRYRADMIRAARPTEKKAAPVIDASVPQELLNRLKTRRSELAREGSVPAYVIFSDRTLIEMAKEQPRNLREFEMLHGVGAAKLERFGEVFLREIKAFEQG